MQSEEAVQIEHRLAGNINAGPHRVILRLAVRHNNVQSIRGASLEDNDQAFGAPGSFDRAICRAGQKTWNGCGADNGKCAVAKENSTRDGHGKTSFQLSVSLDI